MTRSLNLYTLIKASEILLFYILVYNVLRLLRRYLTLVPFSTF